MNPKTDWAELFFSATGRIGKVPFTIAAALLLLGVAVYQSAFHGPIEFVAGIVVYSAVGFMGTCVLAKRLHDRGRSGWWAAVILLAVIMVWPAPYGFFDFLAGLVVLWAAVDLCIMPGERGDNRYGKTLFRTKAAI